MIPGRPPLRYRGTVNIKMPALLCLFTFCTCELIFRLHKIVKEYTGLRRYHLKFFPQPRPSMLVTEMFDAGVVIGFLPSLHHALMVLS